MSTAAAAQGYGGAMTYYVYGKPEEYQQFQVLGQTFTVPNRYTFLKPLGQVTTRCRCPRCCPR